MQGKESLFSRRFFQQDQYVQTRADLRASSKQKKLCQIFNILGFNKFKIRFKNTKIRFSESKFKNLHFGGGFWLLHRNIRVKSVFHFWLSGEGVLEC